MAYFKKNAMPSANVMMAIRLSQLPPMRASRLPRDFALACANEGGAARRDAGCVGVGVCGLVGGGEAGGFVPSIVCMASRRDISSLRVSRSGGALVSGGAVNGG